MRLDGLDLPKFNPEERLYVSKRDLQEATCSDRDNFLRHITVSDDCDASLTDRLRIAEEDFDKIRTYCDAKVVEHEFGLYPITNQLHLRLSHNSAIIPKGHLLAARVEVIRDIAPERLPHSVKQGIKLYYRSGGRLSDIDDQQFVYGRTRESDEELAERDWVLVDIEPHLMGGASI